MHASGERAQRRRLERSGVIAERDPVGVSDEQRLSHRRPLRVEDVALGPVVERLDAARRGRPDPVADVPREVVPREREALAVRAPGDVVLGVLRHEVGIDLRDDVVAPVRPEADLVLADVDHLVADPADLGDRRVDDAHEPRVGQALDEEEAAVPEREVGPRRRPVGTLPALPLADRAGGHVHDVDDEPLVPPRDVRRVRNGRDARGREARSVRRPLRDRHVLDPGEVGALLAAHDVRVGRVGARARERGGRGPEDDGQRRRERAHQARRSARKKITASTT